MLNLQEVSDRLEIQQLMIDYSSAIDQHNFDRLDDIFTPDAYIDYRAMGGVDGRYPEIKAWLKPSLKAFGRYYHMLGNMAITVTGDSAVSRTICFNPMETPMPDGTMQVMFLGLWYADKFVRTAKGWRIAERVEEAGFQYNVPAHIRASAE